MLTYIFVLILLIVAYFTFVSPYFKKKTKVTNDENLMTQLALLKMCRKFDKRSYDKGMIYLKDFMAKYSNSFDSRHSILSKMKRRKQKVMYYFRRMLFRLHNDADLYENLQHSLETINLILDNYLAEAADRKGEYYFKMYS